MMPADLGCTSGGATDEGGGPSFEGLLRGLSAVHEQQREVIKRLSDENAWLRERLRKPGGGLEDIGTSPCGIENVANVKPPAPTEDHVVHLFPEPPPDNQGVSVRPPDAQASSDDLHPTFKGTSSIYQHRQDSSYGRNSTGSAGTHSVTSQEHWPIPDLWREWTRAQGDSVQKVLTRGSLSQIVIIEEQTGQAMTVVNKCYQQLIIRPNAPVRLTWDFLSSIMVFYDLVTIPLMAISLRRDAIMEGGTGPFTDLMDWVTTIFWTIDIPWSFLTGFHSEGVVEMRASEIARHYMKTWFSFDFMLIIIDWAIVYVSLVAGRGAHALGLFRIGKTARMARILRTVRLLRFVKLQRVLSECLELINSEYVRACVSVAFAVAFIFVINHYLACGWFLVGHLGRLDNVPNWIESNGVQKGTVSYAYFTSLHWSLTQFTPASMEIRPFNIYERVYAICCLLFALITFSSFLGSITASISQLRRHTTEVGKQEFILRSYFIKNKVSSGLSKNIWSFLKQHHFNQMTRSHKAQIEVLKLLPPLLQGLLHQELYGPYITRAPFFYHYAAFAREGIVEVCSKGISEKTLICNEILFLEGKVAEKMFFTCSGFMKYGHQNVTFNQTIGTGAWISEPVLWVKWVHVAPLTAETSSEIIELDSEQFRQAIGKFKHSLPFVKVYAQLFHEHLDSVGPTGFTDLMTNVNLLEGMTRDAWYTVTCSRDRSMFKDMPNQEFPRLSTRQKRIKSLMWNPHPSQKISGVFKKSWRRLSTSVGL